MVIPGASDSSPRVFAFVLAPDNLTVVDMAHPDHNEISIRLDGIGGEVIPRELVFVPERATAYLRSEGAGDVLEMVFSHDPPNPGITADNDYRIALAELGAGGGPADIAVYDDLSGRRMVLAATPSTGEVVIIDALSGQFERVAVGPPIDRILLFPAGDTPRVAVLASLASERSNVHVLALDGITDELVPTRLDNIDLEQPVLDVVPVPGRELAMIVHNDDRTVLGLLDVGLGAVSPLQGVGRLDSFDFSAEGAYLIGASIGVDRIGFVDLDNLHPSDLRLDAAATRVLSLSSGKVVVEHPDPLGLITVAPYPGASRDESYVVSGFLAAGLFDEEF
jgi:hypothetical protein